MMTSQQGQAHEPLGCGLALHLPGVIITRRSATAAPGVGEGGGGLIGGQAYSAPNEDGPFTDK